VLKSVARIIVDQDDAKDIFPEIDIPRRDCGWTIPGILGHDQTGQADQHVRE